MHKLIHYDLDSEIRCISFRKKFFALSDTERSFWKGTCINRCLIGIYFIKFKLFAISKKVCSRTETYGQANSSIFLYHTKNKHQLFLLLVDQLSCNFITHSANKVKG